jgi:hypothetical protein
MGDSESDDDDNPLSNLPEGYSVFELDDGWPPANRYAEPSMVATPLVPRPKSVTRIQEAISEELAGRLIDFNCDLLNRIFFFDI